MEFEKTEKMIELEYAANEACGRWLMLASYVLELKEIIEKEEL